MSDFTIQPVPRMHAPRFPLRDAFTESDLNSQPYRTHVSRPLAMALAALGVGGLGAQGLNLGSNQDTSFQLAGGMAIPVGPTIVETIDPAAAQALIARVFAEHGYALRQRDVEVAEGLEAERWDRARHVGVAMLGAEDFSTELAWAYYLQRTLGEFEHVPNDPRDRIANWLQSVSEKERMEVETVIHRTERHRSGTAPEDEGHLMVLDPRHLVVPTTSTGPFNPPTSDPPRLAPQPGESSQMTVSLESATSTFSISPVLITGGYMPSGMAATPGNPSTIEQRAEALQRLERQVVEYIEYLQRQGI
ncbi:hypothetical protein JXA47_04410 [Candidatus Sumerlaeota bacterium]|nr:hypothetical protein [Candidatus Sumerlaeota bacterium]